MTHLAPLLAPAQRDAVPHILAALTLTPHPAFWFLLPVFLAAGALIIYLYSAQRRLIDLATARWLTLIRIGLVAMLLLLFLQPTLRWIHTRTSNGELWILVDQSPSMQSTDPQASTIEHLRWAESLGYLPDSARPSKPDIHLANLIAIASDFDALRPSTLALSNSQSAAEQQAQVRDFTTNLSAWTNNFSKLRTQIADDPGADHSHAIEALKTFDIILSMLNNSIAVARSASDLNRAAGAVDWATLQADLLHIASDLAQWANESAAAYASAHADDPAIARVTGLSRAELASLFLTSNQKLPTATSSIADLIRTYRVRIATFADSAQTTAAIDPNSFPDALHTALTSGLNTHATNLTAGLQAISEQIPSGQPGAILILSDGRANTGGDPTEIARLLASRGVRVYGLLAGSHEVSPDAAVEQIDAPDWIYKGDALHAAAIIRVDGLANHTVHIQLHRGGRNGPAIDEQTLQIHTNQESQRVEFTDPSPPGSPSTEYSVDIDELPGEVNTDNNHSSFRVAVKKDKLYALIIGDRPRWEYRYLASYLARDERIHAQTVLLNPVNINHVTPHAPIQASPENPSIDAQILPQTREQWQAFDLIVLGDLAPDELPVQDQQFIASAVREKGSTLITIAGQRHMPGAFSNTPLADLLPVTLNPQWSQDDIDHHTRFGFRPALAPEGNASVLGQLGLTPDSNAAFWSDIPLWFWHSPFTQAKPSASVLWGITEPGAPTSLSSLRNHALLVTMPVGLGRSLYLASDQTWRLRQVYGNNVHDRFWGQVLRWAVASDLPAGGKFVRFGASQPTYPQGQPVTITARILREDLTPYTGLSFSAHAVPKNAPNSPIDAKFIESPEAPGYYRATLGGLPAGDADISLQGPEVERLLDIDPTVTLKTLTIKILPSQDIELRNMNTDPELLARVAQAGGGFSLDANDAALLASHLHPIQRTESSTDQIGFFTNPDATGTKWAHWSFLLLFTALLTTEWSLRKRAGLI